MGERERREDVFLAFGSNLGERKAWIERAIGDLKAQGIRFIDCSRYYDTAPQGVIYQPRFLNRVCRVGTSLEPVELLEVCQKVEESLGRKRAVDKGPRNIDIDILYYGQRAVSLPRLRIPHPRIPQRAFVLGPLCEIAPDWRAPDTGRTARDMLRDVDDPGDIRALE